MVGDRLSDIEAGLNAGVRTIFVKTGKQIENTNNAPGSYIADNLLEAAKHIVAH